jgi:hypothetical protein
MRRARDPKSPSALSPSSLLVVLLPLWLSAIAGCATTLLEQDIQRQNDGWTIVFHKLADGPNGFTSRGATDYHPESGERFLWVTLSVRNDAASARQFPFDSCALDMGSNTYLPLYVGMNFGTQAEVTKTPDLAAGEEITRKVAYGYPEGRFPEHLICFGNEISLARGGHGSG